MKIKNLKDLRDYLNTLNETQLEGEAIVCRTEEFSRPITEAYALDEDYYGDEEGLTPVSSFEPFDEEDKVENYDFYPKGTVYLSADDAGELSDFSDDDPF